MHLPRVSSSQNLLALRLPPRPRCVAARPGSVARSAGGGGGEEPVLQEQHPAKPPALGGHRLPRGGRAHGSSAEMEREGSESSGCGRGRAGDAQRGLAELSGTPLLQGDASSKFPPGSRVLPRAGPCPSWAHGGWQGTLSPGLAGSCRCRAGAGLLEEAADTRDGAAALRCLDRRHLAGSCAPGSPRGTAVILCPGRKWQRSPTPRGAAGWGRLCPRGMAPPLPLVPLPAPTQAGGGSEHPRPAAAACSAPGT